MLPIISLISDFGIRDPYVGVMKGVILSINPEATIVDISHQVAPQDIVEGAYTICGAYRYFPTSTIHVVVVDPGVGTERGALLIETDHGTFVGPDNGVLSWATSFNRRSQRLGAEAALIRRLRLLKEPRYWRSEVSSTFHGRDIFAPVAAHLSLGVPASRFGPEVSSFQELAYPQVEWRDDGTLVGTVVHVDGFGNLVTNIVAQHVEERFAAIKVCVAGECAEGISRTFSSPGLQALRGSMGLIELVVGGGSAAAQLGVGRGAIVTLSRAE